MNHDHLAPFLLIFKQTMLNMLLLLYLSFPFILYGRLLTDKYGKNLSQFLFILKSQPWLPQVSTESVWSKPEDHTSSMAYEDIQCHSFAVYYTGKSYYPVIKTAFLRNYAQNFVGIMCQGLNPTSGLSRKSPKFWFEP